ncbi:uncharacterized protein LOC106082673 [Stomoxys calcitrans]|uniref:Uncharacterized protein n=1 Tax=Stomoxys calcitrans TaxID=35570 RepID=A0A1I8Q511_STOCA|nr:uncharacterized protein LOC106082673 [Stomoxys calcitrans]
MLKNILTCLIALNVFLINQAFIKNNFNLECYRVTCEIVNPKVMKQFECSYKKLGPKRYSGSGLVMFNQQLDKKFDIHIKIYVAPRGKIVKFLDWKLNVCDTLYAGVSLPLARKIMWDVLKNSNFPRKCPFQANFLYNSSNIIVDESYFPKFTPSPMDLNISFEYIENQERFAIQRIFGATVPNARR